MERTATRWLVDSFTTVRLLAAVVVVEWSVGKGGNGSFFDCGPWKEHQEGEGLLVPIFSPVLVWRQTYVVQVRARFIFREREICVVVVAQ